MPAICWRWQNIKRHTCRRSQFTLSRLPTKRLNKLEITFATSLPDDWNDPVLARTQAEALLKQPHYYMLVTAKPFMAGYVIIQAMPGTQADVLTIFVQTQYRQQNIGHALMQAALNLARQKSCTGLTLEVESTNIPAINLYKKNGLEKIATRPGYYRHSVSTTQADAVVMAISLA